MIVQLRFRRATSAEWASTNPILAAGEPGWDSSVNRFKIGNGVSRWDILAFQSYDPAGIQSLLAAAEMAVFDAEAAANEAQAWAESAGGGGGGGSGGTLTQDPNDPGTFISGAGTIFVEDPNDPGTFLMGA